MDVIVHQKALKPTDLFGETKVTIPSENAIITMNMNGYAYSLDVEGEHVKFFMFGPDGRGVKLFEYGIPK